MNLKTQLFITFLVCSIHRICTARRLGFILQISQAQRLHLSSPISILTQAAIDRKA